MKTPPLLMAAGLLFWGWQSDLLLPAALMAVILESSRVFKARWEMSDAEVIRVWNFCSLLGLAAVVLAFTTNDGPADFSKLFDSPSLQSGTMASNASTQAAITIIRWLPFVFYLFALAQVFSSRPDFPVDAISPFLRYRRRQLLKKRRPTPPLRHFNASWPFFIMCLFSTSAHPPTRDHLFFWGLCALLAWALWSQKPAGFACHVWLPMLLLVIVCALSGQYGFGKLARLAEWATGYNAQWLARWMRSHTDPKQTQTAIGQVGRLQLSSQILLRVTPVNGALVPTYLREATYRSFIPDTKRQTAMWRAAGTRNDFAPVPEVPVNSGHWELQPGITNEPLVNISCYLEDYSRDGNAMGLLALPVDCDHLDHFLAYSVQDNNVGTVLAEGPGYVSFDASYGSGHTTDEPPDTNEDLLVPDKEKPALKEVISGLPLAGLTDSQKALLLSHYFDVNYEYTLFQDAPKTTGTNQTALANFLLNTHRGHCEYFATATVLLLREMHIPARYAVGYLVHESAGRYFVVRSHDAHAWCLVWNARKHAWQTLDTTPASWVADEEKHTSPWHRISDFFSWLRWQFFKFRYGQSNLRPYILVALVPTLGYLLYQIIFHRRRHQPAGAAKPAVPANWPGLDSEYYLLEKALTRRGLVRRPGESQTHWLHRVAADPAVAGLEEPLRQLLMLHYRLRFDPQGLNPDERGDLSRAAKDYAGKISGG